jgi:hypothetical protein
VCLFFAIDIGPPRAYEIGGLRVDPGESSVFGRPPALIHAARPSLHKLGWTLLALSALLWLWDAGTSK